MGVVRCTVSPLLQKLHSTCLGHSVWPKVLRGWRKFGQFSFCTFLQIVQFSLPFIRFLGIMNSVGSDHHNDPYLILHLLVVTGVPSMQTVGRDECCSENSEVGGKGS